MVTTARESCSEHLTSGKGSSELHHYFEMKGETPGSLEEGETVLHVAARTGNETDITRLIQTDPTRISREDNRGWMVTNLYGRHDEPN